MIVLNIHPNLNLSNFQIFSMQPFNYGQGSVDGRQSNFRYIAGLLPQ